MYKTLDIPTQGIEYTDVCFDKDLARFFVRHGKVDVEYRTIVRLLPARFNRHTFVFFKDKYCVQYYYDEFISMYVFRGALLKRFHV